MKNIPLFPFAVDCDPNDPKNEHMLLSQGATLHDFYVGMALMGYLSKGVSMGNAVHYSFEIADQVMKKREELKK